MRGKMFLHSPRKDNKELQMSKSTEDRHVLRTCETIHVSITAGNYKLLQTTLLQIWLPNFAEDGDKRA
jgi:hypothetical protein